MRAKLRGSGFRVQGLGFRVLGLGFRVLGLGFRVYPGSPRGSRVPRKLGGSLGSWKTGLKVQIIERRRAHGALGPLHSTTVGLGFRV